MVFDIIFRAKMELQEKTFKKLLKQDQKNLKNWSYFTFIFYEQIEVLFNLYFSASHNKMNVGKRKSL